MDVLVAGAGPVGLFAAHTLAKNGVPVGVVDTGIWGCSHSYALALHPGTVDLLCKAGLADNIVGRGNPVNRVAVYDGQRQRAAIELNSERPMVVLPQSDLEAALELALDHQGVQVKWRHKVARVEPGSNSVRVTLHRYEKESRGYVVARTEWAITKTWTVEVPYVIGADGYNSVVRHALNIPFPEVGPSTWYAVFEFESDDLITDEVRIVLGEATTDVVWPLGKGWFRWGFEIPDYVDAQAERLADQRERYGDPFDRLKDREDLTAGDVHILPDSRLAELIAARAPWFKSHVGDIGWRTMVRFERRMAGEFGHGRCWLAGDSAHLGAPIGVQSLNVGLAEARDLCRALALIRSDDGLNLLTEYNKRYQAEWKKLHIGGHAAEAINGVDPWIWENRDRLLPCLPAYGSNLTSLAAQIGLRV